MDVAEPPAAQRFCLDKIADHRFILDLGYAYDGRAAGRRFGDEVGYRVGEIVDFEAVFRRIPLAGTLRRELKIEFTVVVDGVEQVFEIVERYAVDCRPGGLSARAADDVMIMSAVMAPNTSRFIFSKFARKVTQIFG